jgi:hypothetical protein
MLICLEGPSAVGKTTTSQKLAEQYGAYIIPEVNQLFDRPTPEPALWYFERQVERWSIAQEKFKTYELVVFDGDPFQPLWYNWSFNFVGWQPLSVLRDFYRQQIITQRIGFPDQYILLCKNEIELRQQKENDLTRKRKSFEKHLQLIESQKHYFQALNTISPGIVYLIDTKSVEWNAQNIISHLSCITKPSEHQYSLSLFDALIEWLHRNQP